MSAAVPEPTARYESYSHVALAALVEQDNDPVAAGQAGARWAELARRFDDSTASLVALSSGSRELWEGDAGDAMRAVLAKATGWLGESAAVSAKVGDSVAAQADVAARARAEMPPPVEFDPAAMIRSAAASGSVLQLAGLSIELDARRAAAEAARQKAIDVVRTRDEALRGLVPGVSFPAAPALGSGPA
ncbi:PPE domain-containing protein [Amycolatopsis sp. FDAARGOS 1241]|uniref:PPE domain-containing protein n=1 Tax=Amycolatopsis sp. FDAARGOS 1241 TaxID=2778070 RepID=UPI00194DB619|nr:PPE domain-containing protein [Amycolatopsis sp. FDAARGOS 1241]QRP48753.1 PPE domain-containing protein [Amycolatopsis sp. FDAARGOS 1241]